MNQIADTLGVALADIWANASSWDTRMGRWEFRFFSEGHLIPIGSTIYRELAPPIIGNLPGASHIPELCIVMEFNGPRFRSRISIPYVYEGFVTSTGQLATVGRVAWSAAGAFMGALSPVVVRPARLEWEDAEQVFVSAELQTHNHRKTHTPYRQGSNIEP